MVPGTAMQQEVPGSRLERQGRPECCSKCLERHQGPPWRLHSFLAGSCAWGLSNTSQPITFHCAAHLPRRFQDLLHLGPFEKPLVVARSIEAAFTPIKTPETSRQRIQSKL